MKIEIAIPLIKSVFYISLFVIPGSIIKADNSEYLFSEFRPALVVSIDKRQYQAEVNYSFMYNEFVFKDVQDNNLIKVFDPVMGVRSVKVGDRIFLIDENRTTKEVLQDFPHITVRYKGKKKLGGKNVGYGGKSETSAVDSYSHLYSKSGGPVIELKSTEYELMGVDKTYEIDRNGKIKAFMFPSKFIKLYPRQIQQKLEAYIDEQKIDFGNPAQVVVLYNYAESLARQLNN